MEDRVDPESVHGILLEALYRSGQQHLDAAERTKIFVPTKARPNSDGHVPMCAQDLKYNKELVMEILTVLKGYAPPASAYQRALHIMDSESEWTFGTTTAQHQDADGPCSPWARYEGQVLHDMIGYAYRLTRNSNSSTDADLASIKALVPQAPVTRKRSSLELGEFADTYPDTAVEPDAGIDSLDDDADTLVDGGQVQEAAATGGQAEEEEEEVEELPDTDMLEDVAQHIIKFNQKMPEEVCISLHKFA